MRVLPLLSLFWVVPACGAALTMEPYPFKAGDTTIAAELGTLQVPQRHAQADGPTFTLKFVRLPRLSGGHAKSTVAPVVYLAGGPGGSGIDAGRGPRLALFQAVREVADVILLDQRGTGLSEPPPRCPHTLDLPPDQPLQAAALGKQLNALARRCATFWAAQGVDLDAYNTVESAHDLESLRIALDAPALNLWGMSYGTHLAMATLRAHGDHLQRVVSMGSEGLHQTYKPPLQADRLLRRLAAQLPTSEDNAQLLPRMQRVFARLDKEPVLVEFPPDSGLPPQVRLGAFDLQLTTALALATTATSRLLPAAYAEMDRGDFHATAGFVLQVRARLGALAAMPLAMDLASGASLARLRRIATEETQSVLGVGLNFPFPQIGKGVAVTDLGESFRAPLRTDVPTLFISGTLDGRTPPENAEEIRRGFTHSAHLVLDGAGHDNELFLASPELGTRIARFFAGGELKDETLATPLW